MNEAQKAQIESMLLDIVDNMDMTADYPTHKDFKREWLNAVVDVTQELIRKL